MSEEEAWNRRDGSDYAEWETGRGGTVPPDTHVRHGLGHQEPRHDRDFHVLRRNTDRVYLGPGKDDAGWRERLMKNMQDKTGRQRQQLSENPLDNYGYRYKLRLRDCFDEVMISGQMSLSLYSIVHCSSDGIYVGN